MTAGTGTWTFRRLEIERRMKRILAGALPLVPLAAPVAVIAFASAQLRDFGYGGIYAEPAFRGQTAREPSGGNLDLQRLEQQLREKIDQRQTRRGVRVTNGVCERTGSHTASCGFFGSDGSMATLRVYMSQDGSRYWTPATDSP